MNLNEKPWLSQGIMGSGLSFVGMSWCVKKRSPPPLYFSIQPTHSDNCSHN
uniref:Uncharacterized protein n=1 Tax=Nelumbo nucifera TaxID=4432 RepID=A0A822Z328_NELNU|nr:TPA_asm: hypothetical protein HUJ06_013745 [Nelumbo nucifera]